MTDRADVAALRALEAKATPGEWKSAYYGDGQYVVTMPRDRSLHFHPRPPSGLDSQSATVYGAPGIARTLPGDVIMGMSGAELDGLTDAEYAAQRVADGELIVAIRNAAPSLLAEVERLRAENERLKATAGMQPLVRDEYGVVRFKKNAIVEYIVDWCARKNGAAGYDPLDPQAPAPSLNEIAVMDFSAEDRMQLAQLIGYSVCGYGELSYTTDESYDEASKRAALAAQEHPHA